MRKQMRLAGLAAVTVIAAIATTRLGAQAGQAPIARYAMDVGTTSGFMAGGVKPMAMLLHRGGGGAPLHNLSLRLGSTLTPTGGAAHADHFVPDGAQLGPSVPLETPIPAKIDTATPADDTTPQEYRRPKGRLLLFWGCGAHAGPGQPVIIDFAKLAAGQMPPALFSTNVPPDRGPTLANSRTFGSWPNGKSRKQVSATSSLIGQHRIAGNYSPEIAFSLDQDFMPALTVQHAAAPDGSQPLSWNAVTAATGYYAWLFGAKQAGNDNADMIWWTSASRREFGGGLSDWLAPATVSRLIGEKVVMPPSQTSCTIPAEVKAAAGGFMMTQLFAYGPERNFAYPPRPANPRVAWKPQWTARVRYRSNTSVILGMPGMDASGGGDTSADPPKKRCKGIGGILGGRVGC